MADITIIDVQHRIGSDTQFVDVREDFEVAVGMIPSARHISLPTLSVRLRELDRSRPVVTICRSGNRSAQAAEILRSAGFQVDNMAGGMLAWYGAGLPVSR